MVQTTTKLLIYQKVCIELGQRTIRSSTDTGQIASYTNVIYNDAVLFCLAQGMWHTWAVRFVSIPASTDIEPQFGWTHAFDIPADFVRIAEIADNDRCTRRSIFTIKSPVQAATPSSPISARSICNTSRMTRITGSTWPAGRASLPTMWRPTSPGRFAGMRRLEAGRG